MGLVVQKTLNPQSSPLRPPASKPRSAGNKEKRAQKPAALVLRLENPHHALLCPPADYVDCRTAIEHATSEHLDCDPTLFTLTYKGSMRGYGEDRSVIWTYPSEKIPHLGALTWPLIKKTRRTEIDLEDAGGRDVFISQFSAPKVWIERKAGDKVNALGSLREFGRKLTLNVLKEAPERALGTVWPQYAGIPGQINGERIEILVNSCIQNEDAYLSCVAAILGETGLSEIALMQACGTTAESGFQTCQELLRAIHRPSSTEEGRLALEYARRITALGIQATAHRRHLRHPHPKAPLPVNAASAQKVISKLAMPLTKSQIEVALQVTRRLGEPKPLNALLSGDVGTGKTLSFLIPAVAAHLAGSKVAILAPRTLLADQIAKVIGERFGQMGVMVERVTTGGKIKSPSAILVSTHGLANTATKQAYEPDLLICDEQHKFSAEAREALVADHTHVLEVSATPVPRSLAASLYEGMEILNLRESPVEKTIYSELIDMAQRREVIAGIKHTMNHGGVAAMIFPVVNSTEGSSNSVTAAFGSLSKVFPGQVVMLHGDMPDDEMQANVEMLKRGEKRLVVASSVLEIGIDIPSVNFMAVRDADRFGVSQLHQLRGRLVRNGGTAVFMMVVEDLTKTPAQTLERLQALIETTDGYKLSEMDLVQRGFGDLDGSAQSGKTATIFRNIKLSAGDFLARKLKTISAFDNTRQTRSDTTPDRPRQGRLI